MVEEDNLLPLRTAFSCSLSALAGRDFFAQALGLLLPPSYNHQGSMSSLPRLAPSAKSAQGPLSQLHRQQALRASAPSINASFSSSASASSSASSSLPSSSSQPPPSDTTLTWDKYLNIRKQRVRYGLATTYPTAIASMFASGSYFLTQEVDPTNAIMGIDPVYVALLETIGTGCE
jgi:hypothetical protein